MKNDLSVYAIQVYRIVKFVCVRCCCGTGIPLSAPVPHALVLGATIMDAFAHFVYGDVKCGMRTCVICAINKMRRELRKLNFIRMNQKHLSFATN